MKTDRNKYPLRKIVGVHTEKDMFNGYSIERQYELLECGHLGKYIAVVDTGGMYGTKSANSRRCKNCAKLTETDHEKN